MSDSTVPSARVLVGEPLPALCDTKDLARFFGVARSTVYDWDKAGKLRRFEARRPLGAKRWSGALLQAYAAGGGTAIVDLSKAS